MDLSKVCSEPSSRSWYCSLPKNHDGVIHVAFHSHNPQDGVSDAWRTRTVTTTVEVEDSIWDEEDK